jgi:hypothetical protein
MESRTLREFSNIDNMICERCKEDNGIEKKASHTYMGDCTSSIGRCLCSDCARIEKKEDFESRYAWMGELDD